MKIKKILIGVLAAVLATSAAACGGGNTTTEDRNHIEMYVMDAGYRTEVFDELAKAFKVHFPDVTMKIYPSTGVDSKLTSELGEDKTLEEKLNPRYKYYDTYKDKYYSISWVYGACGIMYNANYLSEENEPKTTKQFIKLVQDIAGGKIEGIPSTVKPLIWSGANAAGSVLQRKRFRRLPAHPRTARFLAWRGCVYAQRRLDRNRNALVCR